MPRLNRYDKDAEYIDYRAAVPSDSEHSAPDSPTPATGQATTPLPSLAPHCHPLDTLNTPVASQRQKVSSHKPAGGRKRKQADDVWHFVEIPEGTNHKQCKFSL